MLIRWDTLLIAAAVAGGSMLIENSHRVDTGAPDDEVVAAAPAACTDTRVEASTAAQPTISQRSDDGAQVAHDDAAPVGAAHLLGTVTRYSAACPAPPPCAPCAPCSWRSLMRADLPRRPRR